MLLAIRLMALFLLAAFVSNSVAQAPIEGAQVWDRTSAMQATRSVDTAGTADQLLQITLSGNDELALNALADLKNRTDWPAPAREQAVYSFTQSLRGVSASAVPPPLMNALLNHKSTVMVQHEDHPNGLVPLFNIGSAAAGVQNRWRTDDAIVEAAALLRAKPESLVDAVALERHPATQRGYLLALQHADDAQLAGVVSSATQRLQASPGDPALTALAGKAALAGDNAQALSQVINFGSGAALAPLLREAAGQLNQSERQQILLDVLQSGNTVSAALAIAELGPGLSTSPVATQALIEQLGRSRVGCRCGLNTGPARFAGHAG